MELMRRSQLVMRNNTNCRIVYLFLLLLFLRWLVLVRSVFKTDLGENYFILAQLITYRYKKDQSPFRGNQMASYFPDILRVFNFKSSVYRKTRVLPL